MAWFFCNPAPDETTIRLRQSVLDALQPGQNPAAATFWSGVLADHIRNQHRKRRGLDPIIGRWDHNAPERIVTITEVAA